MLKKEHTRPSRLSSWVPCVLVLSVFAAILFAPLPALAQEEKVVFTSLTEKMYELFGNMRTLAYVLGGFGIIGVGTAAIFGKISWSWFAGLCGALFILGAAEKVIKHVTNEDIGPSTEQSAPH